MLKKKDEITHPSFYFKPLNPLATLENNFVLIYNNVKARRLKWKNY